MRTGGAAIWDSWNGGGPFAGDRKPVGRATVELDYSLEREYIGPPEKQPLRWFQRAATNPIYDENALFQVGYDDSWWQVPFNSGPRGGANDLERTVDPSAVWIWPVVRNRGIEHLGVSTGSAYFRHTFTIGSPKTVTIYGTGDNTMDLYLDGARILTTGPGIFEADRPDVAHWSVTFSTTVTLSAGAHLLAAKARNLPSADDVEMSGNPGGLLVTVMDGASVITHSDLTWTCVGYLQVETELPNIMTIATDESLDNDVATATITIANQWMRTNTDTAPHPGEAGTMGYFSFDHGVSPMALSRWGHVRNEWAGVLTPNALIRTYGGYGGDSSDVADIGVAVDDGNLLHTGTWLVDNVRLGTDGVIELKCRGMAKLLIEQHLYPPLAPASVYPIRYCFPPNTMITLADGRCMAIQDIAVGDAVLGPDGKPALVSALLRREYKGEMVSIRHAGSNESVTMTAGHHLPVCQNAVDPQWDGSHRYRRLADAASWHSITAQEVEPGRDWVRLTHPIDDVEFRLRASTLRERFIEKNGRVCRPKMAGRTRALSVPAVLEPSDALATIVGLYLAEGAVTGPCVDGGPGAIYWTFHQDEGHLADALQRALDKLDAGTMRRIVVAAEHKLRVDLPNQPLATLLGHLCGTGSRKKQLAAELMLAPRWFQQVMLDNYLLGDGYESKSGVVASTSSDVLAEQLVLLGGRLGSVPLLHRLMQPGGPTYRERRFTINRVTFRSTMRKRRWLTKPGGGQYAAQVTDVDTEWYEGPVFNLTVEPDHQYAVNGLVVDNCRWIYPMEDVTTVTGYQTSGPGGLTYTGSGNTFWYPPDGSVHGHSPADAFDGNPDSFWVSVGNDSPNEPFATEYIEGDAGGVAIDAVTVSPYLGNYQCYVSIMENGNWVDMIGDPPYAQGAIGRYAMVPAVMQFGVPWEESCTVALPRVFHATAVRFTFTNLADTEWGPYTFRACIREVGVSLGGASGQRSTPITETHLQEVQRDGNYCVDTETEILTPRGWLRYDEVQPGDEALAIDPDTGTSGWEVITDVFREHRQTPMVAMRGRLHDSLSTPDHRWITRDIRGAWSWKTTDTLNTASRIPTAAPRRDAPSIAKYSDDFVELIAWFYTEGSLADRACLSQSKVANPMYAARIERSLRGLYGQPGPMKQGALWNEQVNVCSTSIYRVSHLVRSEWTVVAPDRVPTPEFLCSLTSAQLALFIDTSIDADGHRRLSNGTEIFGQKDERRIRAFEMACVLAGRTPNTTPVSDGWSCTVRRRDVVAPTTRSGPGREVTAVDYDGVIWCPTLRHHNWLARRNGKVYYTGNTDFADIVKDLLRWAGFYLYSSSGQPDVYGNIEMTGSYSSDCFPEDQFDKKPVIDAINTVKEVVGFIVWIDDTGAAHFESPNWWSAGNFYLETGQHTDLIPDIDEAVQLSGYTVQVSDADARSQIIIATDDPLAHIAGALVTAVVPPTFPLLKGMVRPAMWASHVGTTEREQRAMADLVSLQTWFKTRQAQATMAANPAIGINDQVRFLERTTAETYIHYVRGKSTQFDRQTGSYTMTLTTHWLGDADSWAVQV